jgi:hypothetical protein
MKNRVFSGFAPSLGVLAEWQNLGGSISERVDFLKTEARKEQHKRRSPAGSGIPPGLWHFFNDYLKKHMTKSYKIASACATARHGTSI